METKVKKSKRKGEIKVKREKQEEKNGERGGDRLKGRHFFSTALH